MPKQLLQQTVKQMLEQVVEAKREAPGLNPVPSRPDPTRDATASGRPTLSSLAATSTEALQGERDPLARLRVGGRLIASVLSPPEIAALRRLYRAELDELTSEQNPVRHWTRIAELDAALEHHAGIENEPRLKAAA